MHETINYQWIIHANICDNIKWVSGWINMYVLMMVYRLFCVYFDENFTTLVVGLWQSQCLVSISALMLTFSLSAVILYCIWKVWWANLTTFLLLFLHYLSHFLPWILFIVFNMYCRIGLWQWNNFWIIYMLLADLLDYHGHAIICNGQLELKLNTYSPNVASLV